MSPLEGYRLLLAEIEKERLRHGLSVEAASFPCEGCVECCDHLSVLPIEAQLLLEVPASNVKVDEQAEDLAFSGARLSDSSGACPFRGPEGCMAAAARPLACRMRGLPFLELTADGDWQRAACYRESHPGEAPPRTEEPVAPIEEWVARLWELNRQYCRSLGIAEKRLSLSELARRPQQVGVPYR